MEAPAQTPIHPALYRPLLLAGTDPGIAVFEGTVAALLLIVVGPRLATLLLLVLYLAVVHPLAVWAASRDPLICGVYLRSLRYAAYYPAAAVLDGRLLPVRPSIPSLR